MTTLFYAMTVSDGTKNASTCGTFEPRLGDTTLTVFLAIRDGLYRKHPHLAGADVIAWSLLPNDLADLTAEPSPNCAAALGR